MKSIEVTQQGLDKLKAELENLTKVKRPEVINRIKSARALGDLSENSEWEEARNEQSFVEGRIQELEEMIKYAKVITKSVSKSTVSLGSSVKVKIENDEEVYEIVSSAESDALSNKISSDSPLGKALIGSKAGESIKVSTPSGILIYKVVSIS